MPLKRYEVFYLFNLAFTILSVHQFFELCDWMPGVACRCGYIHLRASGLRKGNEHPRPMTLKGYDKLYLSFLLIIHYSVGSSVRRIVWLNAAWVWCRQTRQSWKRRTCVCVLSSSADNVNATESRRCSYLAAISSLVSDAPTTWTIVSNVDREFSAPFAHIFCD